MYVLSLFPSIPFFLSSSHCFSHFSYSLGLLMPLISVSLSLVFVVLLNDIKASVYKAHNLIIMIIDH